jgi:hypothetical protein
VHVEICGRCGSATTLENPRSRSPASFAADATVTELGPDQELRELIAQVVGRIDRLEAEREREKAYAEERAIAKARAAAPKRPWWRLGQVRLSNLMSPPSRRACMR